MPNQAAEIIARYPAAAIHQASGILRRRESATPRARVMQPCPHCWVEFSARDLRAHRPKCDRNPRVMRSKFDSKI